MRKDSNIILHDLSNFNESIISIEHNWKYTENNLVTTWLSVTSLKIQIVYQVLKT